MGLRHPQNRAERRKKQRQSRKNRSFSHDPRAVKFHPLGKHFAKYSVAK